MDLDLNDEGNTVFSTERCSALCTQRCLYPNSHTQSHQPIAPRCDIHLRWFITGFDGESDVKTLLINNTLLQHLGSGNLRTAHLTLHCSPLLQTLQYQYHSYKCKRRGRRRLFYIPGVFLTGTPPKNCKYKKVNLG